MRTYPYIPVTTGLVLGVLLAAACGSAGPGPAPVVLPASPSGGVAGPPVASASATAATVTEVVPSPVGLVPLWPFTTLTQVQDWQAAYRNSGHQPWHLDVDQTALGFVRSHLRYTEIDRITSRWVSGRDARIGVGWQHEETGASTVAVLHLVRFGSGADAPWVVVGTQDASLTLTTPRYGATVTSPVTIGGRITGVDESLHVIVVGPTSGPPLAEVVGIPAGGERTPWTARSAFSVPHGTVLTIAVSTGGHIKTVERFAITAVRVG